MKKYFNKLLHEIGVKAHGSSSTRVLDLPTGSTVLIHIGKCGGSTVRDGIENATRNFISHEVHIKKPVYRPDLKYIIVARGPISRLISAFQWRYKLVVSDGHQRNRFEEEYDVLVKYRSLNNIAEALYHENGEPNLNTHQEIRKIHHIREDISFYLHDLLARCKPHQITAVLMQENLDEDIYRVFGYRNKVIRNHNPAQAKQKEISDVGLYNLMRFFEEDYKSLIRLYCWGKIERDVILRAL